MEKKKVHHILVVEDEKHIAFAVKYNLEAEGFRVTTVEDGPAALKLFDDSKHGIDLILLDLMLPGMSGYVVCQTLRDAGHTLPVLILSARSLTEDRTHGFDVGANQYLTKPFELDELLSRVKNLLSLQSAVPQATDTPKITTYQIGEATVNFETHEAAIGDQTIRMTALQLKLLQYFISNQDRVVSRQELLENVWDMPGHVNTRAPDQFMRQLRKLFEEEPSDPQHFLTIRDAGYRFIPNPDNESE